LDVKTDRETALKRLAGIQREALNEAGFARMPLAKASQVHSANVVRISSTDTFPVPDCDALITTERNLCLGIYVADCAAVYVADRHGRGIGLAHSGRKGTELGIVPKTIAAVCAATGAAPQDLIVQISPCIRPPHYEVDFAAEIRSQAVEAGVREIHDCMSCTGSNLEKYYSYRKEERQTGRLLAAMALI
jgi:YfiH family protein